MVRQSSITLESECSAAERALLIRILSENDLTDRHLEIGTAAGGTLKELIAVYEGREHRPDFVVIDPLTYFEDQFEKIRTNLESAGIDPDSVAFWKGTSQDYIQRERVGEGRFDFVFIDGDHRHYPVTVDLQWADLLNTGGYICLHDRREKFPGVGWAIDRFLERCPEFEFVEQADSLVALRKRHERQYICISRHDLRQARLAQLRFKLGRSLRKRFGRLAAIR